MSSECASCEAVLGDRDRYCPSCGNPNASGSRHPRFAPAFVEVIDEREVYPAPEPPPPGGFACPRCEGPVAGLDQYCRGCGLFLEQARARASAPPPDPRRRFQSFDPDPFRPSDVNASILRVLCWTSAAVAGASAAVHLTWLGVLVGEQDAVAPDDLERVSSVLARVAVLAAVATLLAALLWFRRAYANLGPLEAGRTQLPVTMAVLGWLVPPFCIVVPKLTTDELWRRSGPHGPPMTAQWARERTPLALHLWWPAVVVGAGLSIGSWVMMPTGASVASEDWRVVVAMVTVANLTVLGGLVAFAGLVGDVVDRQALRHELLAAWRDGAPLDPRLVVEDPERPWLARPRYTHSSDASAGRY
jgi:hypothetical protein